MTSIGRNQPCPCGSGQKYKHCCEGKREHPAFSRIGLLFGIGILIVLAGGVTALLRDTRSEEPRALRDVLEESREQSPAPRAASGELAPGAPRPKPEGPAPAGKVWSPEHGHWHDAPAVQIETQQGNLTGAVAPADQKGGLIWNEEHGHYHRAAGAPSAPTTAVGSEGAQEAPNPAIPRSEIPRVSVGPDGQVRLTRSVPPPGPAPEGKVWSSDHGHWHDAATPMSRVDPADQPAATPPPAQDPE